VPLQYPSVGRTRRVRYKWPVSYQPADAAGAAGAADLAVLACRALSAAGQGDMIWGHASVRDPRPLDEERRLGA
jgi:hypothetical protein